MIVHRAAWLLPVASPPVPDGWVAVERGRIVAVGGAANPPPRSAEAIQPRGTSSGEPVAILPGLVNAHVHLELSPMRGAVPPASSMPGWAASLIARRRSATHEQEGPIKAAIEEARAFGTALVGEVTNTLATYGPLAESPLSAAVFYEQVGFQEQQPDFRLAIAQARIDRLEENPRLRCSVVPHAPYSVSPALLRGFGRTVGVLTIHLGESAEEVQFLSDGSGAWRELLQDLGAWNPSWTAPRCGPVEYIARAGLLHERLVAVHGVQLTDEELERLAAAGATLVSCPRSNLWTGAGAAPVERFYGSGVRVAVGTDSLASVADLSIFSELAALRAAAPRVRASRLIQSATQAGAEALGFGSDLGTIEPGKRAELLAVRVPADVIDVEEYLVSGIAGEDIRWLES